MVPGFCGFWLSWFLVSVVFWLSWFLAFVASVAFSFRGFWILCGFWLSWLSSHAKERRREGRKARRKQGRGLLRRVACGF